MPATAGPIVRHRLDNGLTVLVRNDPWVPVVTSMIWYRVGARNENAGLTGISHFLEHMMFKGTKRYQRGQIDYVTMINGGANNAFTSHDYTAYYFSFASDRWERALEVESSRMQEVTLDPDEFDLEKQVIIEELKMDLDSPWGSLRQAVEMRALDRHPYRYPIIGLHSDVENLKVAQMRRHYQTYYRPNNATLVIVGDIDPNVTLRKVRRLFGKLPPGRIPRERVAVEPPQRSQKRLVLHKETQVQRFLMAFHSPAIGSPDSYAIHVLDKILSEGRTSRLYRRLVEKEELASFVTSEFSETTDPYLFFIRAEIKPGVSATRVEKAIFDELQDLAARLVGRRELQKAKNQISAQFLESFETTLDQAIRIGMFETIAGDYRYMENFLGNIARVSAGSVQKLVRQYFRKQKSTLGLLLP